MVALLFGSAWRVFPPGFNTIGDLRYRMLALTWVTALRFVSTQPRARLWILPETVLVVPLFVLLRAVRNGRSQDTDQTKPLGR